MFSLLTDETDEVTQSITAGSQALLATDCSQLLGSNRMDDVKKKSRVSKEHTPPAHVPKSKQRAKCVLTDAHRHELRAIWKSVSEKGRLCLPSLTSRKEWAEAHGLGDHVAVSGWFCRAKGRAKSADRKNHKENLMVEDDVVEISKEEAMKEWKLVLEGDGSWAMNHVFKEIDVRLFIF